MNVKEAKELGNTSAKIKYLKMCCFRKLGYKTILKQVLI